MSTASVSRRVLSEGVRDLFGPGMCISALEP